MNMLKKKKYIVKIYDNDRFLGTPYFRKKYFRSWAGMMGYILFHPWQVVEFGLVK